MLPDIKVSLPLLLVLWCVGGYFAMNGPVLLAYPAMWAGVAVLYLVVTKLMGGASTPQGGASSAQGGAS